mgnify:CR=1 FL=1
MKTVWLGGYDINGDGIDEIFVQAGSNPRPVVGIGVLWLPLAPDPLTCTVEGPEVGLGGTSNGSLQILRLHEHVRAHMRESPLGVLANEYVSESMPQR